MAIEKLLRGGVGHHQAGRLDEAAACYREALAEAPGHPHALHYLGLVDFQRGCFDEAAQKIQAAVRALPQVPEFHVNLGNALKRAGRSEEAVAAYREALRLRPNFPEAAANLGLLLEQLQRAAAAIEYLQKAVAARPDLLDAQCALARCLEQQGAVEAALQRYALAASQAPTDPGLLLDVANIHLAHRRHESAIGFYRRVVQLDPTSFPAWNNLGAACAEFGRLSDSAEAFRRALALQPGHHRTLGNLANVLKDGAQHKEALATYRQALALAPGDTHVRSNYLYAMLYSDEVSPATLISEHRHYETACFAPTTREMPVRKARPPGAPLRVGYVSADFRNHPVAFFIEGIVRAHDPRRVTVFAYHLARIRDAYTARLQALVPNWRDVSGASTASLAAVIADDEIDVLIDLAGHTADNCLDLFVERVAPVQVNYLGYPFSTGLSAIGFRLVDGDTDPAGSDNLASEKLIRLPRSYYAYTPPADAPAVAPLPALQRGYLSFGVCSNLAKVSNQTLDRWAGLLRAFPGARLFWRTKAFSDADTRARMLAELVRRQVSPERIEFAGWSPHGDRWAAFAGIDIALDTFPYNQATNTCEALWMGVPTLTIPGETHQARMGASILNAAGLPEFVCDDEAAWLGQAEYWGGHLAELAALRGGLRQRLAGSVLLDVKGLARAIEDALDEAYAKTREAEL